MLPTKPCPKVPHPPFPYTPPGTVSPPLPVQPMPAPDGSFREEIVPNAQPEPSLAQLEATPCCPIASYAEEEADPPSRKLWRAIRSLLSALFSSLFCIFYFYHACIQALHSTEGIYLNISYSFFNSCYVFKWAKEWSAPVLTTCSQH